MAEKDKELENSVKEIPGLVQKLKEFFSKQQKFAEIKIGEKTFSYSGEKFETGVDIKDCPDGEYETEFGKATVKGGKVIDLKPKESPATVTDFSTQIESLKKEYEAKFASQKTDFDAQVKALGEKFTQAIADLVNGKLKEMFELIEKIAALPSEESKFKKKDGEQVTTEDRWTKLQKEAANLSKQVFKN